MRRAAVEADGGVGGLEPVDDAAWRHGAAALGADHRTITWLALLAMQFTQRRTQVWVKGDAAAVAHLGDPWRYDNNGADLAPACQHHRPREAGDFSGAQSGAEAEQHHGAIARGLT